MRSVVRRFFVPIPPPAPAPDSLPCTPAAIRAVLAAQAGPELVLRFDHEVDAAFEQAEQQRDLTPFVQVIRRWWQDARALRRPENDDHVTGGARA
jgi:Family of unknown function (DUF6247)